MKSMGLYPTLEIYTILPNKHQKKMTEPEYDDQLINQVELVSLFVDLIFQEQTAAVNCKVMMWVFVNPELADEDILS